MKLRNPMLLRSLTKPGEAQIISVTKLAFRCKITPGHIYHLLNGRREVTPEVAQHISEVIHEEIAYALFEQGEVK
ncbi:helix-turn-helix domain-containing protein [Glutamicibacter ardleyensis]|uniref:helix-turn-helix domain-containing protein n=1 Tax=Glutamicibacter ardleyensis TaxID=225894 RepID=UPI003FD08560